VGGEGSAATIPYSRHYGRHVEQAVGTLTLLKDPTPSDRVFGEQRQNQIYLGLSSSQKEAHGFSD
jgi:hypothetical protein